MKEILKKQFCEKLTGKKIVSITPSCNSPYEYWCEELTIVLETGEELKIKVGCISGQKNLWFEA